MARLPSISKYCVVCLVGALALAYGALWAFLGLLPGTAIRLLRLIIPADRPLAFVANERLRWAGLRSFRRSSSPPVFASNFRR